MSRFLLAIALCVAVRAALQAVRGLVRCRVAAEPSEASGGALEANEGQPAVNLGRLTADLMAVAADRDPQGYGSLTILQFRGQIETVGAVTDGDPVPLMAAATLLAIQARENRRDEVRQRLIAAGQGEWVG